MQKIRPKMKSMLRAKVLPILVCVLAAALYFNFKDGKKERSQQDPVIQYEVDIQAVRKLLSTLEINSELMLINEKNQIDEDFLAELVSAYRVVALSNSGIEINPKALVAADALFEAAKEKGYPDFFINSGFRTFEKQTQLYRDSAEKRYVQKPGSSEHQTGLALDLSYIGLSNEQLDRYPQGLWLQENAWRYGFILRYPKDKVDTTGILYEPWHFRYVGLPHAYYCYKNQLCLEEYMEFLSNQGKYTVRIDNSTYKVYYTKPEQGAAFVPVSGSYEASADNRGGYVITVKE